ncbi:hypothetical protein SAMN04489761_3060 [Tenacibaculum sp. MAR_2009_124]|uniref:hypothetical protein n=1 Tax=Tenacibaculum sp. MAR_2009_124 TaxID=1250059 RepID=UPI000896CF91|nr:hypothetical protein [Tenacibaculum sp. MAR_2009_124]SEC46215.1 hypothetical protein SAMN04489761_3060 [Tenacibaculum sp. MAR_2009_124]
MNVKVEHLEKLVENKREFKTKEIHNSLRKKSMYHTWGVTSFCYYHKKGLALKFNIDNFKGVAFITLSSFETFSIYFIQQMRVKKELHLVHKEELLRKIDKEINYLKEITNNK